MMDNDEVLVSRTGDIVVSACPVLVDESAKDQFLWGYYLCIENNSEHKIHIVGKDWHITDERGNRYNDNTAGFKGEIPELDPGECFEFTSTAPIDAANAVFYGSCKIIAEGKTKAEDVRIPTFLLAAKSDKVCRILN